MRLCKIADTGEIGIFPIVGWVRNKPGAPYARLLNAYILGMRWQCQRPRLVPSASTILVVELSEGDKKMMTCLSMTGLRQIMVNHYER